ncbi:MAG TPA: SRPBCC family protein [Acidobacteriaceae bacterium]|nr:SRPBCC family protein [Acidobacteriaceae bacterium]
MNATETLLPTAPPHEATMNAGQSGYTLDISRMFDAPRDLVYKAFTDPAMLAHWMGPRGFQAIDITSDLRAGGKWRLRLHAVAVDRDCDSRGQTDLWMQGEYLEVAPPERLVYTFGWDGRTDIPEEQTTITVTFREMEGKTVMDFKQAYFESATNRDEHNAGWSSAFDRFAEFLLAPVGAENSYDLVIEREFDAPRDLVWKVWTDPAMAAEWAGPRGVTATHFEQDARVGGKWRLCLHSDGFDQGDGVLREQNLWQGGVFREIVPPERIVYTFAWDNPCDIGLSLPPHQTLITVRFSEHQGKTWMVFCQEFFLAAGERDGHGKGWNSAFDKFAELLAKFGKAV